MSLFELSQAILAKLVDSGNIKKSFLPEPCEISEKSELSPPPPHPAPPPWRHIIARWPIPRRKRWGELANKYEDGGMDWRTAEKTAFDDVEADGD